MTKLFDFIPEGSMPEALRLLNASYKDYEKDQILILPSTPLRGFGLVEKGAVEVLHTDADGNVVLMAKVTAGQTFGEALYYLNKTAPVEIRALNDTRVVWLDVRHLNPGPLADTLKQNFINILCERSLALNKRIQILSQLSLREKVLALITQNNIMHGQWLDTGMTREELSLYLGTNRSALSRELSRMQTDGILVLEGSRIKYN